MNRIFYCVRRHPQDWRWHISRYYNLFDETENRSLMPNQDFFLGLYLNMPDLSDLATMSSPYHLPKEVAAPSCQY
jgi:hypothetical protein